MDELLRSLIKDLEAIETDHEEVGDTDVREAMREPIHEGFISPKPGFVLGEQFAMFTPEGNARVREALRRFLDRAPAMSQAEGLTTPMARLNAFQNGEVLSADGHYYDDFFGYTDEP